MPGPFNSYIEVDRAFKTKQIAALVDGPWLLRGMFAANFNDLDVFNIGIALPPGSPFVGGSNLIVWKSITDEKIEDALSLVRWLSSPEVQKQITDTKQLLPVRRSALDNPLFTTDANHKVLRDAVLAGRQVPQIPLWAHL